MTMLPDEGLPLYYVEGASSEDHPDDPSTPFPGLPPGVHPMDPSTDGGDSTAAPADRFGSRTQMPSKPLFPTDPGDSFPVFERSSNTFTANMIIPNAGFNGGVVEALGRQIGRKQVILSCPAVALDAASLGVLVAPTEAEAQNGVSGWILYPGETLVMNTEAPVYIGVLQGNQTGKCRVISLFNPPGGELGAQ